MTLTVISVLIGVLTSIALMLISAAFTRQRPALAWALENLSASPVLDDQPAAPTTWLEKLGHWGARRLGINPSSSQRALLRLKGISDLEFLGSRLLYALTFAAFPLVASAMAVMIGFTPPLYLPPAATLVLAAIGWFTPLLQLRQQATTTTDDSSEALLVFIDLVVLERLSNASAVDAITNAAFLSDNALFVQIQQAVNRAALENIAPWRELDSLAEAINLPQLADVARIAQLQNEGASMAEPLRARVAELRNAYLLRVREENVSITQRMDILQMLPVLSIMMIFVAAPLLRLALS